MDLQHTTFLILIALTGALSRRPSLHPSLGIPVKLVHEKHSPDGNADDLQVLFPLESFAGEPGSVGIDGKIVVQRKAQKGAAGQYPRQGDEDKECG